ncbi:MAG: hypothetical protein AB7L65_09700 [Hyphomonadaceae bacterium]
MNRLIVLAALALVGACASTPTPYGPAPRAGAAGFSDMRIEADRYRVTYRGARGDAPEKVNDFALLRASDVTLEAGYDWFTVVGRETEQEIGGGGGPRVSVGVGGSSYGGHTGVGMGVGMGFPLGGGSEARGPRAVTLDIRLGHGAKPEDPNAYDARQVQSAIRARM